MCSWKFILCSGFWWFWFLKTLFWDRHVWFWGTCLATMTVLPGLEYTSILHMVCCVINPGIWNRWKMAPLSLWCFHTFVSQSPSCYTALLYDLGHATEGLWLYYVVWRKMQSLNVLACRKIRGVLAALFFCCCLFEDLAWCLTEESMIPTCPSLVCPFFFFLSGIIPKGLILRKFCVWCFCLFVLYKFVSGLV